MVKTFKINDSVAKLVDKTTFLKTLNYIDSGQLKTPYLVIDGDKLARNAATIGKGIQNSKVFYAVKANPAQNVLDFLNHQGTGFEISSMGELNVLAALKIAPERIISSNPVKIPDFITTAYNYGIRMFSLDSTVEVKKISALAPGSSVYVRLSVPNEGSEWPLSKKFGVEIDDAVSLILMSKDYGLNPVGVTFHVGSQCNNVYNWNIAVDKAGLVFDMAARAGVTLSVLNIGGGYPIKYTRDVPGVQVIEQNINKLIAQRFGETIEVHLEPGRSMVGDAGIMVSRVTGKADRLNEKWLYIDVGVFNGLMESIGGIKYSYIVETTTHTAAKQNWVLAGPSCDSFDVIDKNVYLNEPEPGDMVLILSGGAYTISYASEFNGCAIPHTVIV
ncbi:MAG: type III PLP-dependent enzyme [Nitrospirae bacterium]|nr:type III PLP-dependent enzyme [Nitrospirota bacterium]MBF0533987.1 type III PLP-dependent enzyme [Nitrospirota bacterium]MBF0616146.1 type III PLP-dependent enzyme [Nitrospirota bacterium]